MTTNITLYHWNQCGHCVNFLPVWKEIENKLDKMGIIHKDYEYTSNAKIIEKAGINAFPTIVINKNGKEYHYKGDRTEKDILNELLGQNGGYIPSMDDELENDFDDDHFKMKYKKYKTKYYKLCKNC